MTREGRRKALESNQTPCGANRLPTGAQPLPGLPSMAVSARFELAGPFYRTVSLAMRRLKPGSANSPNGRGCRIRTRGSREGSPAFKAGAIDRSANPLSFGGRRESRTPKAVTLVPLRTGCRRQSACPSLERRRRVELRTSDLQSEPRPSRTRRKFGAGSGNRIHQVLHGKEAPHLGTLPA